MAALTELYSQVMRERPELSGNRAVTLFIQDSIEIMRQRPQAAVARLPEPLSAVVCFEPTDRNR